MDNVSRNTFRKSLRNAAINYRNGWFFVTCQMAGDLSPNGMLFALLKALRRIG